METFSFKMSLLPFFQVVAERFNCDIFNRNTLNTPVIDWRSLIGTKQYFTYYALAQAHARARKHTHPHNLIMAGLLN